MKLKENTNHNVLINNLQEDSSVPMTKTQTSQGNNTRKCNYSNYTKKYENEFKKKKKKNLNYKEFGERIFFWKERCISCKVDTSIFPIMG